MHGLNPPDRLRWLFLDMNSYFASVEQQERPECRGKPTIVVPLMTDSTCAIAASYEAKVFGIKTGTPVWEAKKKCPSLIVIPARFDMYVAYHKRIVDEVNQHIPVEDICSIDEMACRLDKSEGTATAAETLAKRIKRGLKDNVGPYIRASIGLAPSKLLAKIATDMQKPDGLVTLSPDKLPHILYSLNLRDIPGISQGIEGRLFKSQIYTLQQFLTVQPKHARHLWGSVEGERFWYSLHGYDFSSLPSQRGSVSHSQVLAPEYRNWEDARIVGRKLIQKAAVRLRRLEHYSQILGLSLRLENRHKWSRAIALDPTDDTFAFLKGYEELWQLAQQDLKNPRLLKIGIFFANLIRPDQVTPSLFEEGKSSQRDNSKLFSLIDNLNNKYGKGSIMFGLPAKGITAYTGTKIAFNRIPDAREFNE